MERRKEKELWQEENKTLKDRVRELEKREEKRREREKRKHNIVIKGIR